MLSAVHPSLLRSKTAINERIDFIAKASSAAFIPAIALHPGPAAGLRSRETGGLVAVGTEGDSWSSSSYGGTNPHNAGYLYFIAGRVNPLNNTNRANAFPVRCVQASAGLPS